MALSPIKSNVAVCPPSNSGDFKRELIAASNITPAKEETDPALPNFVFDSGVGSPLVIVRASLVAKFIPKSFTSFISSS